MRESTKYAIRATLWILVAMPAMWFVLTAILRLFGVAHRMPFSNFVFLMVGFGALAIYNYAAMTSRAEGGGSP
jgi:hypothetical protein